MLEKLFLEMISYYSGDPKRIQHFTKVHSYAKLIGEREQLSPEELYILEAAAYTHDIGIKPAEEKYGSSAGKLQEQEGPAVARGMLMRLGFAENVIERVCYLIGHHHTYTGIEGRDYQILVEADFLVADWAFSLAGASFSGAGAAVSLTSALLVSMGSVFFRAMMNHPFIYQ